MRRYDKLVRDHIPALIRKKGQSCRCHAAPPEDLPRYALAKLKEEMGELIAALDEPSKAEEEIADVMEVITLIVRLARLDEEDLLRRVPLDSAGMKVDPEQYVTLLWNSVQPFTEEFGSPETLTRHLRAVIGAVDLLFFRGGLSPIAVCLHMNKKREERGGFAEGIILDEA